MSATPKTVESRAEAPRVIAPDALALFARRAARFEKLADAHVLGDWLLFQAALTRAQDEALNALPPVPLPDEAALSHAHTHHMPPLPAEIGSVIPAWRTTVLPLLLDAAEANAPETGRNTLRALHTVSEETAAKLAEQVLTGNCRPEDAAVLPIIGAALQVCWTHMAARLGASRLPSLDVPGVCPCCGSLPVTSVIRTAAGISGLRYLHCSLCNTEWNLVRVKCTSCNTTEGITYRHIEGYAPHVRAETCEKCMQYLKIINTEKEPHADPVADDLATLALDFLIDEASYARSGPNLLLVGGTINSSPEGE
jgi:FdhE protein